MKTNFLLLFSIFTIAAISQTKIIESINWNGTKKMSTTFMTDFIQSKVGVDLDSLKLVNDVDALTRLNGISKVTFEVNPSASGNCNVTYTIVEDFTIIPNASLWTTDITTAYRIGLYDFNFLGRNNAIGAFYQYNGIDSYGAIFASPFLFSTRLGLEVNFQKLGSIEPLYIDSKIAQYQYVNTASELLAVYRYDYRNSFKLGFSVFNEDYQYLSGVTKIGVPQQLNVEKYLFKLNYLFDNLKYDFYLVKGFRNATFLQIVETVDHSQKNFLIGWSDFSYFKRVGERGNWANRLRLGLSTNDPTPFAPFSVDNNLNIRGVGNIIDRGTGTIVLNTEFRQTFFEKKWFVLQGNAFVDSGSWRQPGGNFGDFIHERNLRIYSGLGLRFIHKTIFNAMFRIDYGFGITKNSTNGLVFGIGQYF